MEPKIRALVFEMDGLLFDSERVVQKSWYIAGERLGYPGIGDHIYHTLGFNVVRRSEYFRSVFGEEFPGEQFNQMTREIFHRLKEEEGVPKKPGVEALLSYGKEHGYLLGLATSSRREYSTHLLQDGGIWDYFDAAVFGDMVTHAKPDPEIYQKACEALGAAPQEAVALEDSPNGIRSAHAAGMRTIVVPDLVQPDGEIRRLCTWQCASLADVIDLLNA